MLHFVQIQITPLIFRPLKRAFFLLNVAFYALRRDFCYSEVAQKREIFKFLLLKILKKVGNEMGGVSAIFEESWSVMTLPTTLDDPDCYADGTAR